ncbi:MAG: PKD domain-containing protein [Thermoplasmata archaeon]|nr:PKD domain-containing protein [Thermoplasmata archaeon]
MKSFPEDRAVEKIVEDVEEFIPLSENLFRDVNIGTYTAASKDIEPVKAPDIGDYRNSISQNPLYASQPESDVPQTGTRIEKKSSKGKLTIFLSFFIVLILMISVYFIFLSPFSKIHGGGSAISIVPNFSSQLINGTTVLFTDVSNVSTATVDNWIWDFGDGNISNDQNPVHTYSGIGYFNVTLILISNGKEYNTTKTIHVYNVDDIDNDGYENSVDLFPYRDAMLRFQISRFMVKDQVYNSIEDQDIARVYFAVYELFNYSVDENGSVINWNQSEPYFIPNYVATVNISTLVNASADWNTLINVQDNVALHVINVRAYVYNPENVSLPLVLDLDGNDSTLGLTLFYNLTTGEFYGDDNDGVVDGSEDGIVDDMDCYLEYSVKTV